MRNKKIGTWIARLLITMLTFMGLGQTMVHAEGNGTTEGPPLTNVIITKVVSGEPAKDRVLGDGEDYDSPLEIGTIPGTALKGVKFTYYLVTEAQLNTMLANPAAYDTVSEVVALPGVGAGVVTDETDINGQVSTGNLAEGFYWFIENPKGTIVSSTAVPFGLALPFTNRAGTGYLDKLFVYPKNVLTTDEPDIVKTVDKPSVAVGELHTWTVSLGIPVGIEEYDKFSFYDNIDSRLDFEGIEHVIASTENNLDLIKGTDYTVAYASPRLDVVFTPAGRIKLKNAAPKTVNITLKTRVNNTAGMGENIPNNATLVFNNGHGVDRDLTPEVPVYVYTGGKVFVKQDKNDATKLLPGATFIIKGADDKFINVGEEVGEEGYITYVTEALATPFTSDANGAFEIKGLKDGTYTLVEIKAPNGYALPTNREVGTFVISQTSYDSQEPQVIDNRALVIPQTGGIGTALFTVIGAVMMLFSALFYKRTKEA